MRTRELFRSPAYGTISLYDYRIEAAALVELGISTVAQSRTPAP
jgi:hypothetical protein